MRNALTTRMKNCSSIAVMNLYATLLSAGLVPSEVKTIIEPRDGLCAVSLC